MFFAGGGGFGGGLPPGMRLPPGFHPGMFAGGHGHGGHDEEEEESEDNSLYDLLEVPRDASQSDIKKSYMRKAIKGEYAHPDRGGDAKKFQMLQKAYEILSDPEKRATYDRAGLAAAESGGAGGGGGPEDLFSMLFGGGGGGGARRGPRKGEDTKHPLRVTLEDCYKGKNVKIAINRNIVSEDPSGTLMDGQTGKRYAKRQEREVLDVYLDRGARDGQHYTFSGKGDVHPGRLPGDVVLVVQVAEHPVFARQGSDLVLKRTVSLYEALCGTSFVVTHLDGRKLLIKSAPGEVIKPDALKEVTDEGMPVAGHTQVKGALFVKFEVLFPDALDLTDAMRKVLGGVLKTPAGTGAVSAKEREACAGEAKLTEPNMDARRQREQLAKEATEPEDEGGGGGGPGGVQCAQQ